MLVRFIRAEKKHDSKLMRLMTTISDRVLEGTVVALAEKFTGSPCGILGDQGSEAP